MCSKLEIVKQIRPEKETETHQMLTFEEIPCKMYMGLLFSASWTINLYWQVPIVVSSQSLLNFTTLFGTFRYKRLCFEANSVSEVFRKILANLLRVIPGSVNYLDNIIFFAKDSKRREKLLMRIQNGYLKEKNTIFKSSENEVFHDSRFLFLQNKNVLIRMTFRTGSIWSDDSPHSG